jgi:hypothetical protein
MLVGFGFVTRVMLCSFRLWFEREKNTHMGVGEILGSSGRVWREGAVLGHVVLNSTAIC